MKPSTGLEVPPATAITHGSPVDPSPTGYRGRLAPSPADYLHLGHAYTFWIAQQRARQHQGSLVLRNEDLDHARTRPEFVEAMSVDLAWFGRAWTEGPDRGGSFAPYTQSQRLNLYRRALDRLRAAGYLYPCTCSRKDIRLFLHAAT